MEAPQVEVVRSARRHRTAQARVRDDGTVVVRIPAAMSVEEEREVVARLVGRVMGKHKARQRGGDEALQRRAEILADRWLDGVRATSVTWSARMTRIWGNCRPSTGEIRLSDRLAGMPQYVVDGVLVHELAHLQVPDHSPAFHALVDRFPDNARARAFLEGVAHGARLRAGGDLIDDGAEMESGEVTT